MVKGNAETKENGMTLKQAIRNARIIKVKTSIGSSVSISKKEARKYTDFCEANNYTLTNEITELGNGKV